MRSLFRTFFSESLKCNLFVFYFFFTSLNCYSQVNDAGLWASVNLDKKVTQKLTFSLSEELRFNENVSELGTAFTEIGADYKFYKFVSLGISYRYIQKKRVDDFYSIRHRYNIDLSLKYKLKKINLTLRERFQTQYADVNTSEDGKIAERYLRSKLTVKYDLGKKYIPFISCELFYQLSNREENEFDNARYAAGFKYEFNKKMSIDLFYLINKEFHVNDPWTEYVTGIAFNYSF